MEITSINLASLDKTNDYIGFNRDISYCIHNNEPFIRYGVNNDLPYWLSSVIQQSPTLNPIITLIYTLTAGDGFEYDESNIALKNFIEDNDLERVFEDCAKERAYFNSSALEVRYNEYGQIAGVGNITIPALRVQNAPIQEVYYLSRDWRNYHSPMNAPFTIPVYNPDKSQEQRIQILYDYTSMPNNFYYGLEFYRAALQFAQTEINLGTHWFSSTQNGLIPSGIITMSEEMSPEEEEKFKRDLKKQFQGSENAGKVLIFNFKGEHKPEFFTISNKDNAADIYDSLNSNITQKIISACNLLNPSLAGLPSSGGFNMTDQLSSSLEYFHNIFIPQFQKPLLRQFAKILKYNGLIKSYDEIRIKKKKALPYYYDSNILLSIFTKNELRVAAGEKPTDQEGADQLGNSPIQTQTPAPPQSPTHQAPNGVGNNTTPLNKIRLHY